MKKIVNSEFIEMPNHTARYKQCQMSESYTAMAFPSFNLYPEGFKMFVFSTETQWGVGIVVRTFGIRPGSFFNDITKKQINQ